MLSLQNMAHFGRQLRGNNDSRNSGKLGDYISTPRVTSVVPNAIRSQIHFVDIRDTSLAVGENRSPDLRKREKEIRVNPVHVLPTAMSNTGRPSSTTDREPSAWPECRLQDSLRSHPASLSQ